MDRDLDINTNVRLIKYMNKDRIKLHEGTKTRMKRKKEDSKAGGSR